MLQYPRAFILCAAVWRDTRSDRQESSRRMDGRLMQVRLLPARFPYDVNDLLSEIRRNPYTSKGATQWQKTEAFTPS